MRVRSVGLALLLVTTALAGCSSDEPGASGANEPVKPGSTGSGSPAVPPTTPSPEVRRSTNERWHFHDYWRGNPNLTLLDTNVSLNLTIGPDNVPQLAALVELPHGTIVPPETGRLTFNATWAADAPGTINLTYRPADSNDFFFGGEIQNGVPFAINVTESNADVPHRQASAWKFNFSARPATPPTGVPPREFHLVITATIGRPLFIDPPHLNWWRDGDVIVLVGNGTGDVRTARTPAGNATLPGGAPSLPGTPSVPPQPPATPSLTSVNETYRVPVDEGRIVPEGTKAVVAMLNWSSQVPDAKLALHYVESNMMTGGPLELVSESATGRVYALRVTPGMTDTTYSNRTTWEFRVVPEGDPAAAFEGAFTLVAWAAKVEAPEALKRVAGA